MMRSPFARPSSRLRTPGPMTSAVDCGRPSCLFVLSFGRRDQPTCCPCRSIVACFASGQPCDSVCRRALKADPYPYSSYNPSVSWQQLLDQPAGRQPVQVGAGPESRQTQPRTSLVRCARWNMALITFSRTPLVHLLLARKTAVRSAPPDLAARTGASAGDNAGSNRTTQAGWRACT